MIEKLNNQESPKDAELVRQLDRAEKLHYGKDEIIVHEVSPRPEDLKSEIPVVFGAGLLQDGGKSRELMYRLASLDGGGRKSLSFGTTHGGEDHNIDNQEEYPQAQLRKVAALMKVVEEKGIDKFDYVGHSEGAVYGMIAAAIYPDRFRTLILDSPIVFEKEDTPVKLITRFLLEMRRAKKIDRLEKKPDWIEKTGTGVGTAGDVYDTAWSRHQQSKGERGGDPTADLKERKDKRSMLKVWEEIRAMSNIKLGELLPILKEKGVDVVISYGVDDLSTPRELIQGDHKTKYNIDEPTRTQVRPGLVQARDVAGLYSMKGGHTAMHWAPEKFALLIDSTITAIEKKRNKE